LKVGSKLQSLKGPISIKTIAKREVPFTGRLYDLKVKGGDRYFVGKDGVAVHGHLDMEPLTVILGEDLWFCRNISF
jgi:hypothetical protein